MDTYEKKYNEALKWMRELYPGLHGATKEDAEHFFPELRESEDERIIRAIIDALYSHTNSINLLSSRGYQMGNIEAWLEKQKYDRMKPVYDNQDSFESALKKAWKDYNDSGARTVDGCEDNYVECAHAKGFREGYLFGLEKQKEQNPAECINAECINIEELAKHIKAEFESFRNLLKKKGIDYQPTDVYWTDYARLFVSSAKKLQKPAEWSEEDERIMESLISLIETISEYYIPLETRKGYVYWLKSLRPSWKPSEEQMNCLCAAVDAAIRKHNESVSGYKPARVLKSLYEQLKKL